MLVLLSGLETASPAPLSGHFRALSAGKVILSPTAYAMLIAFPRLALTEHVLGQNATRLRSSCQSFNSSLTHLAVEAVRVNVLAVLSPARSSLDLMSGSFVRRLSSLLRRGAP